MKHNSDFGGVQIGDKVVKNIDDVDGMLGDDNAVERRIIQYLASKYDSFVFAVNFDDSSDDGVIASKFGGKYLANKDDGAIKGIAMLTNYMLLESGYSQEDIAKFYRTISCAAERVSAIQKEESEGGKSSSDSKSKVKTADKLFSDSQEAMELIHELWSSCPDRLLQFLLPSAAQTAMRRMVHEYTGLVESVSNHNGGYNPFKDIIDSGAGAKKLLSIMDKYCDDGLSYIDILRTYIRKRSVDGEDGERDGGEE